MATPARLAVVIAGGGTGGHLFPGLAVARELLRRVPGAQVTFAGTSRGLEATVVPREGLELDVIRSAGLSGKSWSARLRGAALLLPGLVDAWRIVSRRRPHVVVGVGGYSAGPVVLVAAWRRVPTIVLEQNAVPGLTNRWLARWVRAAAVNFESTLPYFHGKGFVAGNPVRPEFVRADDGGDVRRGRRPMLLVVGGSQGAHAMNVAMLDAAPAMAAMDMDVVHQTGPRDLELVREGYARAGLRAEVEAFLDPVVDRMRAAALVLCRAGATTLAELAAIGRPAILVPLPSADDHQMRNAQALASAGAADIVAQRDLDGRALAAAIARRMGDPAGRDAMAIAMRGFARPDAAARVVDRVLALAGA